ncbi:YfaZ family outer membrane protein [Hahella ganghwensis]|uniref:YfaZ family outer membrane protein n=1 Tax=Hahella ganghwensis TaxID=286420 RepID=UPI00037F1DF0|nr:YfaZ family outer membrane protein [Hahella ganghwensis]
MRRSLQIAFFAALPLLAAGTIQAAELDLNISNKAANAQVNIIPNSRKFDAGLGYIYRESSTHIINADFHARGQTAIGNLPTTVGVGIQASTFDEDGLDGTGLGLGGTAHIKFPAVPGLGFKAAAHYAPSITSFGDIDRFVRFDSRVTYRIIQNADIYAGYRIVRTKVENAGSETLDENVHLGFTLQF